LITGHFLWIKSGGYLRVDSRNDSLSNLRFCDMVSAEHFRVQWRKRLTAVLEEFDECMKFFWVRVFEGITRWHDLGTLAGHGARLTAVLEEFDECMKFFWVRVLKVSLVGMTLAHLPVMGQPPTIPSRFSSTVALTKSVSGYTKLSMLCTQTQ